MPDKNLSSCQALQTECRCWTQRNVSTYRRMSENCMLNAEINKIKGRSMEEKEKGNVKENWSTKGCALDRILWRSWKERRRPLETREVDLAPRLCAFPIEILLEITVKVDILTPSQTLERCYGFGLRPLLQTELVPDPTYSRRVTGINIDGSAACK